MLWLWIDTLFVILQFVVITSVPHILFVTICTLETVTDAANMLHMTVSKLLLLLLLSSTLLKNNIILVYCSPRRGILVSPDLKTIYRSTLPRKCKVLIIIVLLLLLLLLLLSLIAQHRLSTRSPKQSDTLVQSCHIPHQSVHGNVYSWNTTNAGDFCPPNRICKLFPRCDKYIMCVQGICWGTVTVKGNERATFNILMTGHIIYVNCGTFIKLNQGPNTVFCTW